MNKADFKICHSSDEDGNSQDDDDSEASEGSKHTEDDKIGVLTEAIAIQTTDIQRTKAAILRMLNDIRRLQAPPPRQTVRSLSAPLLIRSLAARMPTGQRMRMVDGAMVPRPGNLLESPPKHVYAAQNYWSNTHTSVGIETSILGVNKQLHDEAVSYLYKNIICRIELTQDSETRGRVRQHFIRYYPDDAADSGDISFVNEDGQQIHLTIAALTKDFREDPSAGHLLYLKCLKRIRCIRISVCWAEIFGQLPNLRERWPLERLYTLSASGTLLLQILRRIKKEPRSNDPQPRRLHLISEEGKSLESLVAKFPSSWVDILQDNPGAKSAFAGLKEIIKLLRLIGRNRVVSVLETIWLGEGQSRVHAEREVDLEKFAWLA